MSRLQGYIISPRHHRDQFNRVKIEYIHAYIYIKYKYPLRKLEGKLWCFQFKAMLYSTCGTVNALEKKDFFHLLALVQ